MTSSFQQPFQTVNDLDGTPLTGGYIYFGAANTDPTVLANRISIFYDAACTIAAPNPVRTSGGFLLNGVAPANIYVAGTTDFSVAVHNQNNTARYSIPAYPVRMLSSNITFDALIVGTSVVPDAAGGAFNGTTALPWSSVVSRDLQAKTATVYDEAQPTVAEHLAALNQRRMPVAIGRQTSSAASPAATAVNIYNIAGIVQNGTGIYDITFSVALPASCSIQLTNTVDTATVDLVVFSRSTTLIKVKTYLAGVLTPLPFDFVVFGNPAVADPIS